MASNFNDSVPAAAAGGINVKFLSDGAGNDSAYVPASAIQLTANDVDLTAQDTSISATNLVASPVAGIYRISVYIIVTTADLVSSTLPSVQITWTDDNNSVAQSVTITPTNAGNTTTTYQQAIAVINAAASSIQYATSGYASGTPLAMKYALSIRIEAL
jgi:hypothetical protein